MSDPAPRIWIVDDERNLSLVVATMLERAGFEAVAFNDSAAVLERIEAGDLGETAVLITDLYMPGPGGMELLEACSRVYPEVPVVVITAYGTVDAAVAALKRGAFDFITKPFDQSELLSTVGKAVQTHRERRREPIRMMAPEAARPATRASAAAPGPTAPQSLLTGASPSILEVQRLVHKVAASPSTVLITGESGTGKELVAQEIHRLSGRADKPLIKINCAAIPATLIESELFGYERGAFTGAVSAKPGRFELAHEGSLFLDEVGEMPLEMQVKLLRVLQEQEFERVGGVQSIRVDVRIIVATNRDLDAEVKSGRFREDLFYRLNVFPMRLPPLRERREDLDALLAQFLRQFNQRLKRSFTGILPEAVRALRAYHWPGNIRQLENVVERMVLMGEGEVLGLRDLPDEIASHGREAAPAAGGDEEGETSFKEIVRRQTQAIERELIERALEEQQGNVTRTAEKLGLSRKGLQLKMKELGLRRDGEAD